MPKEKKVSEKNKEEVTEETPLCEKCGANLTEEDGVTFCSSCEGQIDFFGGDDE